MGTILLDLAFVCVIVLVIWLACAEERWLERHEASGSRLGQKGPLEARAAVEVPGRALPSSARKANQHRAA